MNRSERRYRTEKIARKRFSQAYCDYNGKPNAWFLKKYTEQEQKIAKGKCRERLKTWRCRCSYCIGGKFLRDKRSKLDWYFGLLEIQNKGSYIDADPQRFRKCAINVSRDNAYNIDHYFYYLRCFPSYMKRPRKA